jgi:hypothetical protein
VNEAKNEIEFTSKQTLGLTADYQAIAKSKTPLRTAT